MQNSSINGEAYNIFAFGDGEAYLSIVAQNTVSASSSNQLSAICSLTGTGHSAQTEDVSAIRRAGFLSTLATTAASALKLTAKFTFGTATIAKANATTRMTQRGTMRGSSQASYKQLVALSLLKIRFAALSRSMRVQRTEHLPPVNSSQTLFVQRSSRRLLVPRDTKELP